MLKLRALTPIVIALISLATAVLVAVVQTGSAKQETLKDLVEQLNHDSIPRIQDALADIRERIAAVEALENIKHIPKDHKYRALRVQPKEKEDSKAAMPNRPIDTSIPKLEMLDEK